MHPAKVDLRRTISTSRGRRQVMVEGDGSVGRSRRRRCPRWSKATTGSPGRSGGNARLRR